MDSASNLFQWGNKFFAAAAEMSLVRWQVGNLISGWGLPYETTRIPSYTVGIEKLYCQVASGWTIRIIQWVVGAEGLVHDQSLQNALEFQFCVTQCVHLSRLWLLCAGYIFPLCFWSTCSEEIHFLCLCVRLCINECGHVYECVCMLEQDKQNLSPKQNNRHITCLYWN